MAKQFVALDIDGDGDISIKELESLLRSIKRKLRMTDKDITKLVSDTDRNGDGRVSIEEFLKMIEIDNVKDRSLKRDIIHKAMIQRAGVRKQFERYDKDGSGAINRQEFKNIVQHRYMSAISEEQLDELMNKADKDRSGLIDYEEFLSAFSYLAADKMT